MSPDRARPLSMDGRRIADGALEYDAALWHEGGSAQDSVPYSGSWNDDGMSSNTEDRFSTDVRMSHMNATARGTSSRRTAVSLDMSNLFISPNEIQLKEKIGSGGSGVVRRGIWSGTAVAVKQLFIGSQGVIDQAEMEMLRHEAAVFASLRHPNVALFLGACLERPTCFIVTQLYPKGSLQDLLHNKEVELNWDMKCRLAGDAARGLKYLHTFNPPIIHRDVKSSNILIDDSFRARITDFGLTKHRMFTDAACAPSDDLHTANVGTLRWTAPELLEASVSGQSSLEYSSGVDVYSFGVVLFEIATRKLPFEFVKYNTQVEQDVIEGKRPTSYPGCSPPGKLFWHAFGTPWTILMEDCWNQNPAERPSMEVVVERLERLALASGPIEDIEPRSTSSALQMGESPRTMDSLLNPETLTVEEQLDLCRRENALLKEDLQKAQAEARSLHGVKKEKDAALSFIAELRTNVSSQQNECAYLRHKLREYQNSAKMTLEQYRVEQEAELKALKDGGKSGAIARLKTELAEKTAELNRVTELCRTANQEVGNCNLEILALKRRIKQNRSGSSTSSLSGSNPKLESKMIPNSFPPMV